MMMSNIKIEGSLEADDDSDSSSEEEVEVFVENASNSRPLPPTNFVPTAPKTNGINSLSAAMEAAVANVDARDNTSTFEEPISSSTEKPVINNKPDSFGITYQPYKKKSSANKELNIDDDHEFARIPIVAKVNVVADANAEDDDEFDMEEEVGNAVSIDSIMKRVELTEDHVIGEFAENAVENEVGEDAEHSVLSIPAMVNSMTGAMALPINNKEESGKISNDSGNAICQSTEAAAARSILSNSKNALNEIKDIYGAGLGDIEVSLLDMKDDASANKPVEMNGNNRLGGIVGIEEGDEEEEEEEEAAEQRQLAQQEIAKSALEMEWESVEEVRKGELASSTEVPKKEPVPFSPITCEELVDYVVKHCDLGQYRDVISLIDENSKGVGLFGFKPSPLAYNEDAKSKITMALHEFPFLMAHVDFEQGDDVLLRAMQTIYVTLMSAATGKSVPPPAATGPHWENIGFQGQDPRTDVNRSMKMFAILQMLHLISTYPKLACEWHQLSESYRPSDQIKTSTVDVSWPFMCVSIMFTKEVILAFRSGILNAKCNKEKDILYVLHDYHHALFYDFVRLLQTHPASTHHAVHLAEIRKEASKTNSTSTSKGPLGILRRFKTFKLNMKDAPNVSSHTNISVKPNKSKSNDITSVTANLSAHEAGMATFDDLENMVSEEDVGEKQHQSGSMWTNIIDSVKPKGKASKFIA